MTDAEPSIPLHVSVRRIHRRDLNKTWEFLKKVFRDVNRETVEYQRPRSKRRFLEVYAEEGIEQLVFEAADEIVGYAECAFEVSGEDNWLNPRYFEKRGMRPLYVEELAVHPDYQGRGVGSFMLDQLQHLARVRGCTHLVLEVAENNESALAWYRKRSFYKLDAAIFMAQKLNAEPELLPPRKLPSRKRRPALADEKDRAKTPAAAKRAVARKAAARKSAATRSAAAKSAAAKSAATKPAATKSKPKPVASASASEPAAPSALVVAVGPLEAVPKPSIAAPEHPSSPRRTGQP